MRSKNGYEALIPDGPQEGDVYQRIEHCEKNLKTIRRAVLMRIFLTALLVYIPFAAKLQGGVVALMIFVVLINVSGLIPLVQQWKLKKEELDKLLDEE